MAKWMAIGLMMVGTSAFAGTTRGYVVENNRLQFYAGLDYDNSDVQLTLGRFSKPQITTMMTCMKKRETHAIEMTSHEVKKRVPSGVPGRDTFFHDTVVDRVRCVSAPGFIYHWRKQFQK